MPSIRILLAGLAVLIAAAAGPARSGEVPSSIGIALRTPGVLLDEAALQYLFPQAALGRATGDARLEIEFSHFRRASIGRTIGFSIHDTAVSGVVAAGPSRFFVQQRREWRTASGTASYDALEAGAALRHGNWNVGLAAVAGPLESVFGFVNETTRLESGELIPVTEVRYDSVVFETVGGALGLGWGRSGIALDAVLRYDIERSELAYVDVTLPDSTGRFGRAEVESHRFSAALRAAIPTGERSRITAFGEWRDLPVDLRRERRTDQEPTIGEEGRTKGHAVRVAALASRGLPGEPVWSTQLDWQHERSGSRGYGTVTRTDLVEVGVSHRRPLRLGLEMLAGWSLAWWSNHDEAAYGFTDDVTGTTRQRLGDGFSWGLVGRYDRLEIAGVVSGNLDVFDPFLAVDARLRL